MSGCRRWPVFSRNGILPFQTFEAREVGIGGMQHTIVFDRESGELGVGNQIAHRISAAQHLLKDGPMLVGRLNDPNAGLIEPALHAFGGFLESERALM
jgi:hypothetical protein